MCGYNFISDVYIDLHMPGVDHEIYSQLTSWKSMPHSWYMSVHGYRYIHTNRSIHGYPCTYITINILVGGFNPSEKY